MGAGMPILRMASTIDPLEKNVRTSGYCSAIFFSHAIHVLETADAVRLVQGHLDGGRVGPGIGGVQGRKVRHYADVRHHHLEVFRGHRVPDQVLYLGHVLFCDLDARASRNLEVDGELAGVGPGEKCQSKEGVDRQAN